MVEKAPENKEPPKNPEQKAGDAVSVVEGRTGSRWVKGLKYTGLGIAGLLTMVAFATFKIVEFTARLAQGFLENIESPKNWFSKIPEVFKKDSKDKKN